MRSARIGSVVAALAIGCGGADAPPQQADASLEFVAGAQNRPPVMQDVRIEPGEPVPGDTLRAVVSARDPEGAALSLAYRWLVDGVEAATAGSELSLSGVGKGAEVRVSVIASDGTHESAAGDASVEVVDRPPQITGLVVKPPETVAPGQPLSVEALVEEPDGDPVELEYTWYLNEERHEAAGAVFQTDGLKQGDRIRAEVRASDGASWTRATSTAAVSVGSAHPEITSTPPGFRDDGVFVYAIEARDPDGDRRLRYALGEGPEGMVVDAILGELRWRPAAEQVGVFPVSVVVTDSSGLETKQSFQVTVQRDEPEKEQAPAARRRR